MRSKLWVVTGVAGSSALALLAATQQWLQLSLVQGAAAVTGLTLSGQEMNPTLSPLAVAGLAAALALTIAGRVFRYILAVLVIAFGLGTVLIAVSISADPLRSAATPLSEITGITGTGQDSLISATQLTVWPTLSLVGGIALLLCGLSVLVVSHSWVRGGRKYESGSTSSSAAQQTANGRSSTTRKASPEGQAVAPDRISDWEMLSEGEDPSDDSSVPGAR